MPGLIILYMLDYMNNGLEGSRQLIFACRKSLTFEYRVIFAGPVLSLSVASSQQQASGALGHDESKENGLEFGFASN